MKAGKFISVKIIVTLLVILSVIGIMSSGFTNNSSNVIDHSFYGTINKDSIESVKAFLQVYKVLKSPRCMNCHPAGDIPLQGDDNHLHNMSPIRGVDGKGVYAMKCSNCHQPTNISGLHMPPGNPKWGLPPAEMKMVFQGRTAHQLALQIRDYNRNGHKNKEQLLEHARDTLVKAGWNMGEGRTLPPLGYPEFVAAWDTWIKKGAYAPK
ncbi:MAG: c-type cytochrome [Flavisolibacter sp.]